MSQRVLIVEDEASVAAFYRETLEGAGYATRIAQAGPEALAALYDFAPDLALLDIQLEGHMDGFAVLGAFRQHGDVSVVIVTGQKATTADLVRGLDLGADDYVVKPVPKDALLARVRARLRYTQRVDSAVMVYRVGSVALDLERRIVARGNGRKSLGRLEARVLARLVQTPGQPVSTRELLRVGWGYDTGVEVDYREDRRMVDRVIYRLRSKIEPDPRQPSIIVTVWGQGFKILKPDEARAR